jgi:hypothetical protein
MNEPYEANPVCVCGHPASHHDAGCCWTDAEGNESWEFDGCTCIGFEAFT